MNRLNRILALTGLAGALLLNVSTAQAQERGGRGGNFDPEQMRQRFSEIMRERLEVTSDDEWKIIEQRIAKVNEARRELGGGFGFGAFGRGGGGFGRPQRGGDDDDVRGRGGRRFGNALPEAEELRRAIESKASTEELKAKLAKYREARKAKQAELTKAQESLREVLSLRQEAVAVSMGLLD